MAITSGERVFSGKNADLLARFLTKPRPATNGPRHRLQRLIDLNQADLIDINVAREVGLVGFGQPVTQIGHLDRFADVGRRNPRKA